MQAFDDFQDFFTSLNNEQIILLAILGIIILMVGILLGWIIQGRTTRRYKKQLMLVTTERDDLQRQYLTAEEERKKLAKELETVSRDKVEALDRLQVVKNEKNQLSNTTAQLRSEIQQLRAVGQQPSATEEELRRQINTLRTENQSLREQLPSGGNAGESTSSPQEQEISPYIDAIEARFQAFELRLDELTQENDRLRQAATTNGATTSDPAPVADDLEPESNGHQVRIGEPLVIRADTTEPGVRVGSSGETEVIVNTTPSLQVPVMEVFSEEYDDLTEIDTIGPFNQRKLYEYGIYSYEQIASWTDEDIEDYASKIGYIAAIMRNEDWVGQAQELARLKAENPERYQKSPITTERDNLKVVEGIGPKIEAVLCDAGVETWGQLAATPVEELRAILSQAGSNYKSHNPETWPQQAALAVDGEWDKLKQWQSELKGGK